MINELITILIAIISFSWYVLAYKYHLHPIIFISVPVIIYLIYLIINLIIDNITSKKNTSKSKNYIKERAMNINNILSEHNIYIKSSHENPFRYDIYKIEGDSLFLQLCITSDIANLTTEQLAEYIIEKSLKHKEGKQLFSTILKKYSYEDLKIIYIKQIYNSKFILSDKGLEIINQDLKKLETLYNILKLIKEDKNTQLKLNANTYIKENSFVKNLNINNIQDFYIVNTYEDNNDCYIKAVIYIINTLIKQV